MVTYIRGAAMADLDEILTIIAQARTFLKNQGLPQWQDGYGPNRQGIEQDIHNCEGYVFVVDSEVCGYAALVKGTDDSYTKISEGRWDLKYDGYISIHRVAISQSIRGRGLSKQFLRDLTIAARLLGFQDIRIDTHPFNRIMEKAIYNAGFTYRGLVNFPIPNGERKAYQLLLD